MKIKDVLNEVASQKKSETRVISIRLTTDELKEIDALCKKKGTTVNKVCKRLIQYALKEGAK